MAWVFLSPPPFLSSSALAAQKTWLYTDCDMLLAHWVMNPAEVWKWLIFYMRSLTQQLGVFARSEEMLLCSSHLWVWRTSFVFRSVIAGEWRKSSVLISLLLWSHVLFQRLLIFIPISVKKAKKKKLETLPGWTVPFKLSQAYINILFLSISCLLNSVDNLFSGTMVLIVSYITRFSYFFRQPSCQMVMLY